MSAPLSPSFSSALLVSMLPAVAIASLCDNSAFAQVNLKSHFTGLHACLLPLHVASAPDIVTRAYLDKLFRGDETATTTTTTTTD